MCAAHRAWWQHNEPTSRSRSLSLRSSSRGMRHQQSPTPNIIHTCHHRMQHQLASPHQTPPPTTTTLTPSWCKGSTYLAISLSLLLHHAREATQPTWYTPAAHTETTEATHAQHSKQARTKAAAQGWTRNQGRSALPTTPERVALLFSLPVPSHHVFTSPACLIVSVPPLSRQRDTKANRRASGTAPARPASYKTRHRAMSNQRLP